MLISDDFEEDFQTFNLSTNKRFPYTSEKSMNGERRNNFGPHPLYSEPPVYYILLKFPIPPLKENSTCSCSRCCSRCRCGCCHSCRGCCLILIRISCIETFIAIFTEFQRVAHWFFTTTCKDIIFCLVTLHLHWWLWWWYTAADLHTIRFTLHVTYCSGRWENRYKVYLTECWGIKCWATFVALPWFQVWINLIFEWKAQNRSIC